MTTAAVPDGLRERAEVLAAAATVTNRVRAGSGGALFIVGEAGLGKTSVLESVRSCAGDAVEVALGCGAEMEAGLPFGLLAQVLATLGLPLHELLTSAIEPAAPHYAVLRWLEARGGRPVVILVDDLHWADYDSLAVLAFLARRLDRLPLALVGTLRPWPTEAYDVACSLAGDGRGSLQHLLPLTRPSAAALLAEKVGGAVDEATEGRAWALCRGNPLLVEQVAVALRHGEGLPDATGPRAMPDHVLLSRFASLDKVTMGYVRAASVLGMGFQPDLVAAASGLDQANVDTALDALCRSGLIADSSGGELRFSHPLVVQALYNDLAPPVRRRLHARYAELLGDRGLENEAAEHAIRAAAVGDPRSIALLARTGGAALAVGAVATAARHLETAVRLQGDKPAPPLVLQLCQALMAMGRMAEAAASCDALVARRELSWEERLAALRILGRALYFTGSIDHGEAVLDAATAVALEHDNAAAVEPLLDQSLCAWLAGGPVRSLPLAAKARELAAGLGGSLHDRAEATWGHLAYEAGDPAGLAATEEVKRRAERRGVDLDDPAELAWPWAPLYQIAMNANYAGCYEESEREFGRAAEAMEKAGGVNAMATVAVHVANIAVRRGRLEEALHQAARSEEFADLTPTVVPYARLMRAEALAWSGRLAESEACCKLVEAAAGQWFVQEWLAFVRGLVLFWQGDERASDMFLITEEVTNRTGIREPCHIQWQAHAVAAHLAVGRVNEAERVVEWVETASKALPCPWPAVAARLGRARLDAHRGDREAAGTGFRAALSILDEAELPLHRVEAQIAYGGFLRQCGRLIEARRPFSDAASVAAQLGAAHLAVTARQGLNLAGGRARRPAPDADSLTAAELRVAQQAAAGLSNSQIARALYLSVNTVETHMKRVFTKLGIASRRQLMTGELLLAPAATGRDELT